MICPACQSDSMSVSHTFQAGPGARTQRLECSACGAVGTALTMVVAVDPPHGQGARALAERMRRGDEIPLIAPPASTLQGGS